MRKTDITRNTEVLLRLYDIYDAHRKSILWFLEELDASTLEEYLERYSGASTGRSHFITVCGFFELSGVLVRYKMIDQNLYFEMFNPTPFWEKAKPVVLGMRTKRPYIYENFEQLNVKRLNWKRKRGNNIENIK